MTTLPIAALLFAVIFFLSTVVYALMLGLKLLVVRRRNRQLIRRLDELNSRGKP